MDAPLQKGLPLQLSVISMSSDRPSRTACSVPLGSALTVPIIIFARS